MVEQVEKTNRERPQEWWNPRRYIHIERRVDIASFWALILAAGHIVFSIIVALVRGPEPHLFAPEQVVLTMRPDRDGKYWLRINARMALINSGKPGQSVVVERQSVTFDLGGRSREMHWSSFSDVIEADAEMVERNQSTLVPITLGDLVLVRRGEAAPFPLDGGGAVSHEVYFSYFPKVCPLPRNDQCSARQNYISPEAFSSAALKKKPFVITFTFKAVIFGQDDPLQTTCTATIPNKVFERIAAGKIEVVRCRETV